MFNVEYTDTFAGEANYCWVKRAKLNCASEDSQTKIMRQAKASVGLTGIRGVTYDTGDGYTFRPYGMATILFVTWEG